MNDTNPSPNKGDVAELLRIGGQMSNVLHNFAQLPGERITYQQAEAMDNLRKKWDVARRGTPPSPSTAPEVDESAAFEAAARIAASYGSGRPIVERRPNDRILGRWEGEQAASANIARLLLERAALASRPADTSLHAVHDKEPTKSLQRAEVDDEGLPPLPDSLGMGMFDGQEMPSYTAEQYRQGQRDAVAADRAREWVVVGGRRAGRAHMAALARDAARYRWLRESNNVEAISIVDMHSGDSMDARVDQAMAQAAAQRDTK